MTERVNPGSARWRAVTLIATAEKGESANRLERDPQPLLVDRAAQHALGAEAVDRPCAEVLVEHLGSVAAAVLGAVQRQVGFLQKALGAVLRVRCHGDPEAGGDGHPGLPPHAQRRHRGPEQRKRSVPIADSDDRWLTLPRGAPRIAVLLGRARRVYRHRRYEKRRSPMESCCRTRAGG